MTESTWERAKKLFEQTRQMQPTQRRDFLDEQCAEEPGLRVEVEQLLEAHDAAGSFLGSDGETVSMGGDAEKPGTVIGRYKLLQQIGEGGFGMVYMAEQERPVRRKVALKIIKLGMDTKQVIARFEAERQALALMDHPNIARVLDAGSTETGRPYFVMELVRGVPITEYCDGNSLSTKDRLRLFQRVCGAVQHAHQKGIIHRDIKPSNVMVTLHDGTPVPKVIDFGIAKATNQRLTEKTLFTEYRQFIGTPQYMSPEQAEMSGLDVDTRADIYSLGVLLYELLTGTTPFDPERLRSMALSEIHRLIKEEDPHKPSTRVSTLGADATTTAKHRRTDARTLRRTLAGDLDWIVMKALEKDRTRRYDTANALLLDIERHLKSEPVAAGPPGTSYRIRKFLRRNRAAVGVAGAVAAAILTGLGLATYGFLEAQRERRVATQAREAAESVNAFFADMLAAVSPAQLHLLSAFHVADLPPDKGARFSHDVSVVEMLKRSADRMEQAFVEQPLQEARVREILGSTLLGLDENETAAEQFRQALAIREETQGPYHQDTFRSRVQLGTALPKIMGVDAEAVLREVIRDIERERGPEDPLAMHASVQLAQILVAKGNTTAADSILGLGLERQERVLGPDHRDTLTTLAAWAGAYCMRSDGPNALKMASRAYDRAVATYSPDDAIMMQLQGSLAAAYTFLGRRLEARAVSQPLFEKSRRIYGDDHDATRGAAFVVARSFGLPGEEEEVIRHYLFAIYGAGGLENGVRTGHGWFANRDVCRELAYVGRYGEALDVIREEVGRFESVLHLPDPVKEDEPSAADWQRRARQGLRDLLQPYLGVLALTGRWAERESVLRKELDMLRHVAESDDATTSDLNAYAYALAAGDPGLREPQRAVALAERAVARADSSGDLALPLIRDTLARAHFVNGDAETAFETEIRALRDHLVSGRDRGLGWNAASTVAYALKSGRADRADTAIVTAMDIAAQLHPDDPGARAESLEDIGQHLMEFGFFELAEQPLREAVRVAGDDPRWAISARAVLARQQGFTGDREEASRLADEALTRYRRDWVTGPIEWTLGLGRDGTDAGERSWTGYTLKYNLVTAFLAAGRVEEADSFHYQALCVRGSDDLSCTPSLLSLQGRTVEAEQAWSRHVARRWTLRDDQDNPMVLAAYEAGYGRCLMQLDRWEDAEIQLQRALGRVEDWAGTASRRHERIAARLAACERRELDAWWPGGW
jgi:serine/threonine protein kinase